MPDNIQVHRGQLAIRMSSPAPYTSTLPTPAPCTHTLLDVLPQAVETLGGLDSPGELHRPDPLPPLLSVQPAPARAAFARRIVRQSKTRGALIPPRSRRPSRIDHSAGSIAQDAVERLLASLSLPPNHPHLGTPRRRPVRLGPVHARYLDVGPDHRRWWLGPPGAALRHWTHTTPCCTRPALPADQKDGQPRPSTQPANRRVNPVPRCRRSFEPGTMRSRLFSFCLTNPTQARPTVPCSIS
jgi:hypothetical protein